VAHGYYGEDQVLALHRWISETLGAEGARIDAFVYSPFHPEAAVERYRRDAACRKPGPGMILDLLSRFPVDRSRAVMIGDKPSDVEAARAAGIEGVLFGGGDLRAFVEPLIARLARQLPGAAAGLGRPSGSG
jgi:D-glycero-D-manno-heptose 1,7-bisphosphate phosphatase